MQIFNDAADRIDILTNFFERASAELLPLIDRTKEALVPRTVAGEPQQQTSRLTGGTDGSLFIVETGDWKLETGQDVSLCSFQCLDLVSVLSQKVVHILAGAWIGCLCGESIVSLEASSIVGWVEWQRNPKNRAQAKTK